MKRLYLPLAVLGLIVPWYFFVSFLLAEGLNFERMAAGLLANPVSTFFAADLLITAVTLIIFILRETRRLGMRNYGWFILATLALGPSFSFPLFMHFRELRRTHMRERSAAREGASHS